VQPNALKTLLVLLCVLVTCPVLFAGGVGTVWDAREGYLPGIDQIEEPQELDPWSYRSSEPDAYGELLIWNASGQWGSPPAYTRCLNCEIRPVFTGTAAFTNPSVHDPENEQVGGHGNYMVRWTSPINGAIKIDGYIYQTDTPDRLTNWKFLKNDEMLTQGFTPLDENTPLNGYQNRVYFEDGENGRTGTYAQVRIGDDIDLLANGTPGWGCCAAGINMLYRITQVDPSEVPGKEIWNARTDWVDGLDPAENDPWSYHAGENLPNADIEYGDLLVWNPAGQWGSSPAYTGCLNCEERPVMTGTASFISDPGSNDPLNEQIGGHGSYLLRWTSPVDGWVQIDGYIYQASEDRLTSWQILKNDTTVTAGTTALAGDGATPLNGYDNRVSFTTGSAGLGGTFIEVSVDDRLDIITPGTPGFGCCPAGVNMKYIIRSVDENDVPKTRDTWDARLDFAGGLDQTMETNDPWSYRSGEANNYAGLLVWKPEGQWGTSAAYTKSLEEEDRPIIAGTTQFGGSDPLNEQIGGHGSWMVRWTSPIDGTVKIDGYVYQPFADPAVRVTNWQFLKNNEIFTQGRTLVDADGLTPLNSFENRVDFESGDAGEAGTFVKVSVGDNIDFLTPGDPEFDNGIPSAVNAQLRFSQVPGTPTLEVTANNNSATLSWSSVPDGETFTIEGYNIIQTSPLPRTVINSEAMTGTGTTLVGLQADIEYCYTVESVASNGRQGIPSNEACVIPTQDSRTFWDARTDWVDGINQEEALNLPWSYHNGEPGNTYGNLLLWNEAGQWGSPPAYTLCRDCDLRPVMNAPPSFIPDIEAQDPDNEQVGGHGSWMLRWTSPITGTVQVQGYIYQDAPTRLTNWKILKNDAVYTEGFTAFDEFGPLNGYENRVEFVDGTGGLRRTYLNVAPGDTIDLITPGHGMFGDPIPAGCGAVFQIRVADPSEVPAPEFWDARNDFIGGFDQTKQTNDPWSYHSAEPDAYGELLIWNPDGQWGSSPAYTQCLKCEVRPVLAGSVQFGGQDPENEQFGGHAAFMLRWTSPISGTINVEGYIYQTPVADRLTRWEFLQNGVPVWSGLTAFDEFGPLNGFENRVFFEDGTAFAGGGGGAGLGGLNFDVEIGDEIDFVTLASDMFGSNIPAGLNARLRYTPSNLTSTGSCCLPDGTCQTLSEGSCAAAGGTYGGDDTPCGECPTSAVFRRGDCDQSGKLDFNDAIFHLRFLFLGENEEVVNTCRDACDSDDSGTDDFTDDINSLEFLFLGQGAIPAPAPFPDESHPCGTDPTKEEPEELTCDSYTPTFACP